MRPSVVPPFVSARPPLRLWAGSVAAAAMLLAAPALASAAAFVQHFSDTQPVAGETFVNPCTGETVQLTSGSFFITGQVTANQQGGLTLAVEGQAQGVAGVGLSSGAKYQVTGGFWGAENLPASGGTVTTDIDNTHLIANGQTTNAVLQELVHITVTPTGTTTVAFDKPLLVCGG